MDFTVTIAQMDVAASQPERNLGKAEAWIAEAAQRGSDIICFPEMWTTGFDWERNRAIATEQEGVIDRVGAMALNHSIWINGSMLALNEDGKITNTSILFNPEGKRAGTYRKTHLFSMFNEDEHITPGQHLTTVETHWGLFGMSVCYDIRFPELFRTYALMGVQVQLCPSAFPYPRLEHWKTLVRARAIENQMFMIAVNRVGSEDVGAGDPVNYFGCSLIIDPWGKIIVEADESEEGLFTATVDVAEVARVRKKMKVLRDRRPELYELG